MSRMALAETVTVTSTEAKCAVRPDGMPSLCLLREDGVAARGGHEVGVLGIDADVPTPLPIPH